MRIALFAIILLSSCVSPKPLTLFDAPSSQAAPKGIGNFYATDIYSDFITHEIWTSEEGSCLQAVTTEDVKRSGEASLHLKWDKVSQSCPFIGVGFGWDNWSGKNLKPIINEAAIEMWFKTKEGSKKSLPLAACLEDYSGRQAWLGFSENAVVGDAVTTEWTKVRLPLSEFSWGEFGADASNIKQLIIQFEADGDVYLDDMRVVPFKGSFRQRAYIQVNEQAPIIDGKKDGNLGKPTVTLGDHRAYLQVVGETLYVAAEIKDDTPLQNTKSGDDVWNGDGFELAFSTETGLSKKRSYLRSTDQHLCVRLGRELMVWNWQNHSQVNGAEVKASQTTTGVFVEAAIPLKELGDITFSNNVLYGLELAVNEGDEKQRITQVRWNSPSNEGFHKNPGMWGEMIFTPKTPN